MPAPMATPQPVLSFEHVDVYRGDNLVLRSVDWQVYPAQRWAVLGPNGCGKTTLLSLASGYLHPARGQVRILGQQLGRNDVRKLREHVSLVSASIGHQLMPHLSAHEAVVSGAYGALEPWWHDYPPEAHKKADALLRGAGFAYILGRNFGALSEGERQQVLLARALMSEPELLLLDEPCAGLDMGGRERFLTTLSRLAAEPTSAPMVMVTHHVEEVPQNFTHALLMVPGQVLAAGPLTAVLTPTNLSTCFGLDLELENHNGRWSSRGSAPL